MRILCPHCEQVFVASRSPAGAATVCPECGRAVAVPGHPSPGVVALGTGKPSGGIAKFWLGIVLVAMVILGSAAARWFYLGDVQYWVLSRTLPALEPDTVRVRDWYCTRMLKGPGIDVLKLSARDEARGQLFLVLELEIAPQFLAPSENGSSNVAPSRQWIAASHWFKVVGPGNPLTRARGGRWEERFEEVAQWPVALSFRREAALTTVFFLVNERTAEAGELGLVFKWRRAQQLTRNLRAIEEGQY